MNINVVKLSLNGNSPSWAATCVAHPLLPCFSVNPETEVPDFYFVFLHFLKPHQHDTDFVFGFRSWRTSVACPSKTLSNAWGVTKFFQSTWPSHVFFLLARINLQSSFDEMVSKFLEILDSIFRSQRFSVRKSLVHWCVTYMSVVQCWSTFSSFKLCLIQPVIGELLIFEPRSWPVKEWWNCKRNPTGCCPLVCGFSTVCATQWFS